MENLITWLEKQIEGCDDLGGMEKEKWAFIQTLKKVRKEQLTLHNVVDSACICEQNARGQAVSGWCGKHYTDWM